MKPLRLRVVHSTMRPMALSLRLVDWVVDGDGAQLKDALVDAGYLPGDIVALAIVSRLGDRDTEVQS